MSDNLYAGVSVQVYPNGDATLSTPHGDVQAFLDYVGQFNAVNFHAQDDDVREWRFDQEYDNWQDRLGMDSVRVLYHHGHCGMAADGGFVAAMGRTWDNTFLASSSRMSFADQRLRYLLWHGCDSLQMHFGQSPLRTWGAPNKGARMIFGFDGLTYDIGGLGAGFFREWNTGKSFSQSWQDAARATLTNHRPSSTACGATAEEAQDRLWNERLFFGDAVSDNWYWWRWAGPAPLEVNLDIPLPHAPTLNLDLGRRRPDVETATRLADRFGVRPLLSRAVSPVREAYDQQNDADAGPRLTLLSDGAYEVFLAHPHRSATAADAIHIKEMADVAVRKMELDVELAFDGLTATHHAGASRAGDRVETTIRDYTAHYRQLHDGIPAVRGGDGHVRVTLDPSGALCSITDRTVPVIGAANAGPSDRNASYVDALLAEAETAVRSHIERAFHHHHVIVVPHSTDVGYRFDRGSAVAVARKHLEIKSGDFAIRKIVEVVL